MFAILLAQLNQSNLNFFQAAINISKIFFHPFVEHILSLHLSAESSRIISNNLFRLKRTFWLYETKESSKHSMNLNPKSRRAHDMFGDSDMKYQYSK